MRSGWQCSRANKVAGKEADVKDRLTICDTCAEIGKDPSGEAWASELQKVVLAKGFDIDVVTTSCLNMCETPVSFALQGAGKATYLFSGTMPGSDTDDLMELLKLYLNAPDGWIADARKAGRLRFCLRGSTPSL